MSTSLPSVAPESILTQSYDSLEAAQAQWDQDLLDNFPEVPSQPVVEPTSRLDTRGELTLGWAIEGDLSDGSADLESLRQLQEVVRFTIEAMRKDEERCGKVKTLRLLEYGWFQEEEMRGMAEIIDKSPNLQVFQLAQNEATHNSSYADYIEPMWESLKKAPALATLITQSGPIVSYKYDSFAPSLLRLDLSSAMIDPTDGGLPNGLQQLSLDFVSGFDTKWFKPETFDSLEVLILRSLQVESLETITSAVTTFASSTNGSPMSELSIDLFKIGHDSYFPSEQSQPAFEAFLEALTPARFPNLKTLEILSTLSKTPIDARVEIDPDQVVRLDNQTTELALRMIDRLSETWSSLTKLEDLVIFLGSGDSLALVDHPRRVAERITTSLSRFPSLKTLTINLVPSLEPLEAEASRLYFKGMPSLEYVTFRGKSTAFNITKGFKVENREGDMKIEEDGWMGLLGEPSSEETEEQEGEEGAKWIGLGESNSKEAVEEELKNRLRDEL